MRLLQHHFAEPQHTNPCTFTQLGTHTRTHTQVMLYHIAVWASPGVMCSWRWGRLAAAAGVWMNRDIHPVSMAT